MSQRRLLIKSNIHGVLLAGNSMNSQVNNSFRIRLKGEKVSYQASDEWTAKPEDKRKLSG